MGQLVTAVRDGELARLAIGIGQIIITLLRRRSPKKVTDSRVHSPFPDLIRSDDLSI